MATTDRNYRIRFMDNNLAELTTNSITFSSALSAFPGSNATNNKFRSKVWAPSGFFDITATNNLLYINDGSDKTAIITVSSSAYTTPELLAIEIETQLNTVSTGWTCDYDRSGETYRFRIAHASTHTLKFSSTTNSIWDTIGFVTASDEVISTERFADEQRNHSSERVTFDLGYNHDVTFFSVISTLDQLFPLSSTATLNLHANNLDQWDSPPLSVSLTRSDGGLFKFMDDITTGYRFWRFEYIDKYNPLGPDGIQIGYIYLGDYTTLTNRNISNKFIKSFVDPSIIQTSESGALYFDQKTKYAKFDSLSIEYLDRDQRDSLEQLFYNFGKTTPFFVSLDPTLCISNELYDMTKYVVFNSEPQWRHVVRDLFTMSLSFREVL